ncbi:hypothetical protein [Bacillus manliponensis]|uniref:hypothetical protein n=1 Tax=Bacillus manliponensis TaxID=574376 RepID=UPI0012F74893|nr:hypothetical protein [Bacillus manliponensis]
MLILLFFIGLISLIFSLSSLNIFHKEPPRQERAFVLLLISIACFGVWIAMYTFRLNIM